MKYPIFILLSTNRWFVLLAVVCSTLIGMIWYSPVLFGNQYGKWMGIKMDGITDAEKKAGMMRSIPREIVSRVLYFIGLGFALEMSVFTDIIMGLIFAFVLWLGFVFPANMSQTARSNCDSKVLWLIAGNTLVSTLVATAIRFLVF